MGIKNSSSIVFLTAMFCLCGWAYGDDSRSRSAAVSYQQETLFVEGPQIQALFFDVIQTREAFTYYLAIPPEFQLTANLEIIIRGEGARLLQVREILDSVVGIQSAKAQMEQQVNEVREGQIFRSVYWPYCFKAKALRLKVVNRTDWQYRDSRVVYEHAKCPDSGPNG